jgi:DNA modification methylase
MSKTKGLADLNPRTVNPRTMTDDDRARLGKTLREFGDLGGVVMNTKSGQLVGGHQRVNDFRSDPEAKVVIERKLQKPDATGSTAFGYVEAHGTRYSYREVSWPTSKEAAANLAANRVHGDFDMGQVAEMLGEFDAGFDFDLTGFDPGEVAGMLHDETESVDVEPKIDHADDLRKKWGVKLGQVWKLGAHRLMCGDSSIKETVQALLGADRATLVFTDPPYGVSIAAKNRMLNTFDTFDKSGKNSSNRNAKDIVDDAISPDALKAKLLPVFVNVRTLVMAEDCAVLMTAPQNGELGMMMMMMMMDAGLPIRHCLIWKKNAPTFSMGRLDYDYAHEPILFTWGKRHKRRMLGEHRSSVWEIDKPTASKHHPTMKPVALVVNAIMNHTDKADIVFDSYSGSGTTLIACEQTGRQCRAIEIDPGYVAVAIQRWVDVTGGKPELVT